MLIVIAYFRNGTVGERDRQTERKDGCAGGKSGGQAGLIGESNQSLILCTLYTLLSQWEFLPWEIEVTFP